MNVIRATALLVLLTGMAWPASAQTHSYSVYVDRDNDPATGCTRTTPSGTVAGFEAVLGAEVSVEPVRVTGQWLARCDAGVLQPSAALPGSYAVGFDQGAERFDVVELGAPLDLFGSGGNGDWRLVFGSEGALLDGTDLTTSAVVSGLGDGEPPQLGPPLIVPTASLTGLALLALALAIAAVWVVRRRPQLLSLVVVICALGASGIAWAAAHLLDGNIGEWPATPQVTDAANDATQDEAPIDIRQAFASRNGDSVYFRIDVTETRLGELIPVLLDTQFGIAENSPNGTAVGAIRNDATGLGALLALTAGAQTPAAAFAFDPATTALGVADTALLDVETNPQFTFGFTATVDGAPAFSLPITATIEVEDVNETPTLATQTFSVSEKAAVGSEVGSVVASDLDAGANGELGFAITGGSGQGVFAISAEGAITVAAALDAAASPYSLDVTVSDGGNPALSAAATMSIVASDVNDAPLFTPGSDVTVAEDSAAYDAPWGTALADGDDGSQTLEFVITSNDNPALFAAAPALAVVGNEGRLTFTPAANAHGVAQVTVVLRDDGGTADGGSDTSAPVTVTLTVTPVNDAPQIAPQAFSMSETAPDGTLVGTVIATDADTGADGDLAYAVTGGSGETVFTISANGDIRVADSAAIDTMASPYSLDVTVSDGGSPPLSGAATMTITVDNVNDAPTFTSGGDVTVDEDSGPYDAPWATALADGDDGSQSLAFDITANDNPALFAAAPTLTVVGTSGHLAFTPAEDANGTAQLTVVLRDDGGAAGNGSDESAPVTFSITVTAVNDAPTLSVPGAQASDGLSPVVLSTANGNAISVADIDAGAGIVSMRFTNSGSGGLTLANPEAALSISDNGTVDVTATGTVDAFNTALNGATGSLSVAPTPGDSVAHVLTVAIDDQGNTGSGGAFITSATIDIDAPPTIDASPAAGAIATVAAITLTFSEPVDVSAGTVTFDCGSGNLITGADTGSGVTTLTPTFPTPLTEGATCVLGVAAAGANDSDGIDPPDAPVADFSRSYTVDTAPVVTVTSPSGSVATNTVALAIDFSEAVDVSAGAITLDCGGPIALADVTGTGVTALAPSYTAPLPSGACTLTVAASGIDDSDSIDPPSNPMADTVVHFTVDAAPSVTATSPNDGATDRPTDTGVTFGFDEAVTVTSDGITLDCGAPVTGTLIGSGTDTITFMPSAPLPAGATCTATAVATGISDIDVVDPPDHPASDTVISFTTEAAPSVVSTVPANGDTDVPLGSNIVVTFSEPVLVTAASFTLECPAPTTFAGGFAVSGSGTSTIVVNPTGALPADTQCTVVVIGANVSDVDTIDPPDTMPANHVFSFTTVADLPPTITASTPAEGSTVSNTTPISIDFSEEVDVTAGSTTLTCNGGPNLITGGTAGSAVTSLTPTYAAPLPSGDCVLTVLAANVSDSDSIDPPDTLPTNHVVNFTVDAAPTVASITPANGDIVASNSTITVTFSESVNIASATAFSLECTFFGIPQGFTVTTPATLPASATTFVITPASPLPEGQPCTFVVQAAQVSDTDGVDPPDTMVANFVRTFRIDARPAITSTEPATNGTITSNMPVLTYHFSEAVNIDAGALALQCVGSGVVPGTATPPLPATNVTSISYSPNAALASGANCHVTLLGNAVHDVDSNDPPDTLISERDIIFQVDSPPTASTSPSHGATDVTPSGNIVVTFNEPVTLTGGWFQLDCVTSGIRFSTAELTGTGITIIENTPDLVYTIDPTADLALGESCTLTLDSANVVDADPFDAPNELDGDGSGDSIDGDADDQVVQFTTRDLAPTVVSATPVAGSTVANNQPVVLTFSEPVDVAAGGATFECNGTPVGFTPALPQTGISTLTLTPTATLRGGTCVVTLASTLVTDVDTVDPPNQLDGDSSGDVTDNDADDFVLTFSVDEPPTPLTISVDVGGIPMLLPLPSSQRVDVGTDIRVTFSENVDVTPTGITLQCPVGSPIALAGLPTTNTGTVTLNPTGDLPAGTTCLLTLVHTGISDTDTFDPPNALDGNGNGIEGDSVGVTFTTRYVANDDAYQVTPHLTLSSTDGAARVTANDIIGPGNVTGYGFSPACNGTLPGNLLDAGAANGRLTIQSNGDFSYEPPAGVSNSTRTFCYTITGGDTANIAFNIQNTELVWFVNGGAPGGGNGTQARPVQNHIALAALLTANDTVHIASHGSNYTGSLTLPNGVRVIGQAATGTLAAHSGITPVTGSAFPALGGTAPTLGASNAVALTLGSGNTLRGFDIGDTGIGGTDLAGTNFGTLTVSEVVLAGNGRALHLDTGVVAGAFGGLSVTASSAEGIRLNNVTGTVDLGFGSIVGTGDDMPSVRITGNTGATTYSGIISKNNAGRLIEIGGTGTGDVTLSGTFFCHVFCGSGATGANGGIVVSGRTGNSVVTFSGTTKSFFNTSPATLISVSSMASTARVVFSNGGLILQNSGRSIDVTSGQIEVTGPDNVITTIGRALNVEAPATIGPGGLNFRSIDVDGGAIGGNCDIGIHLVDTGSNGLTVTGNGSTPGSGGTVQNCSQRGGNFVGASNISLHNMHFSENGVSLPGNFTRKACSEVERNFPLERNVGPLCESNIQLHNVSNVVLDSVTATGSRGLGINGNTVDGLTLINVSAERNGDESNEDGVQLVNATGTITVTGGVFRDNTGNQFEAQAASGTATYHLSAGMYGLTNFASPGSRTSNSGVYLSGFGSSIITMVLRGNTISGNHEYGYFGSGYDLATMNITVGGTDTGQGNTFANNRSGVAVTGWEGNRITYSVVGNTFQNDVAQTRDLASDVMTFRRLGLGSETSGTVSDNTIGTAGVQNSGCSRSGCSGVQIDDESTRAFYNNKIRIQNNLIHGVDRGIGLTRNYPYSGDASMYLTLGIIGNTISEPNANTRENAVFLDAGIQINDTPQICTEIRDNTITGAWSVGVDNHLMRLRPQNAPSPPGRLPAEWRIGNWDGSGGNAGAMNYLRSTNSIEAPSGVYTDVGFAPPGEFTFSTTFLSLPCL